MEVNGKMCEVHRDDESIKITARDQGKVVTANHVIDIGEGNSGSEIFGTETIVIDHKQRLLETGLEGMGNGPESMHTDGPQLKNTGNQLTEAENNDPKI